MSDFRLKIGVRNARILRAVEADGHRSLRAFARFYELDYQRVIDLVGLRVAPVNQKTGRLVAIAQQVCDALCALPEDLWTEDQRYLALKRVYEVDVSTDELAAQIGNMDARRVLEHASAQLTPRQNRLLKLRSEGKTLAECSQVFGVGRERVRQIECAAVRKMRARLKRLAVHEGGILTGDEAAEWYLGD